MQLPEPVRQRLAEEYRFAAENMQNAPDLPTKLYFFSVFYGEANRALNMAWDTDLALAHMVLQAAHHQINASIESTAGMPRALRPPQALSQALTDSSTELAELFQSSEVDVGKLHNVLTRLAELAYVTTGNGYYLYLRGVIKI